MGPGGAVFGLGNAAAEYYGLRLTAPRRQPPWVTQITQENAALRAEVSELHARMDRMEQFMARMSSFPSQPSGSRDPGSDGTDPSVSRQPGSDNAE